MRQHADAVLISRDVFEHVFKGRSFRSWEDFAAAVLRHEAAQPAAAATTQQEVSLIGLSIVVVVLMNVVVWTSIFFVASKLINARLSPRIVGWLTLAVVGAYGRVVTTYCHEAHTSASGAMRIVTSILFGICPFTTSLGSYLVALLLTDGENWYQSLLWSKTASGRMITLVAVLPGLFHSMYLCSVVATGFDLVGTTFDVLSWCLFVDTARLVLHALFLLSPEYGYLVIPEVSLAFCLFWLASLGYCETSQSLFGFQPDPVRRHVLVCLVSYTLLPAGFSVLLRYRPLAWITRLGNQLDVAAIGTFLAFNLVLLGIYFNLPEPSVLGSMVLFVVSLYVAFMLSDGNVAGIVALLLLQAGAIYQIVFTTAQYGADVRKALLEITPGVLVPSSFALAVWLLARACYILRQGAVAYVPE